MPKCLLLRPDKAGDALKTLPAMRALKKRCAHEEIHLLLSPHNHSLFEFEPGITRHVLPLKTALPTYDTVVNLLCDPSQEADELLSTISGKRKFSANPVRQDVHKLSLPHSSPVGRSETENIGHLLSEAFASDLMPLVRELVASVQGGAPCFSDADHREAQQSMGIKSGRWLGLCPFAGLAQRTLPFTRWERFVRRLGKDTHWEKIFLFGAPSDQPKLSQLRTTSRREALFHLCSPSSFRTLGAYLKRLDGVVAVDSGPLHLARSLHVKSLGILSGGDVKRWFDPVAKGDMLVRRGFFQRYPSAFEMARAFDRWKATSLSV